MHQYGYVNSKGIGRQFNCPLYSQSLIPQLSGIYSRGFSEGWSGQVYPTGWKNPEGLKGYERMTQPVNLTSPAGEMGLPTQDPSSLTAPADNEGNAPQGHNWISIPIVDLNDWESQEQSANWPQLPEHPGFGIQGQPTPWSQPNNHTEMFAQGPSPGFTPPVSNKGFNQKKLPFPFPQPTNHAGMFAQGQQASWDPLAGHSSFNSQNHPYPWSQPIAGMFPQGNPAAMLPPSANPFGYNANGQKANFGGFGNPAGWGGQVNPMGWSGPGALMGWGNNGGNGRPGILGSLFKVGKGTMNGIGVISSLIGMGKFLF
jgi:hypothetical protein